MIVDGVALLLFLAPVPGWVATVLLVVAAIRPPRIAALTERAVAAFVLSLAASAAAFLASARLAGRSLSNEHAILLLIVVCVAVSVPQFVWLVRFLKGDFGRGGE